MSNRTRRSHRRLPWPWVLALVISAGNLLAHKPISDFCDWLFARLGRPAYEFVTLIAIGTGSIAAALVLQQRRKQPIGRRVLLAILALGLLTIAAQRWLLVSNVELIHFPQFALLAALLLGGGMQPRPAWLLATAAGIADEVYQWLVIYAGVPDTYLDFNDMLLNAIGATWAVLLWPSVAAHEQIDMERERASRLPAVALLLLAWLIILAIDPPSFDPLFQRAATGRDYRVLNAGEALGGGIVLWLMIVAVTPSAYPSRESTGA